MPAACSLKNIFFNHHPHVLFCLCPSSNPLFNFFFVAIEPVPSVIRQPVNQADAQYHHQQPDRHDDEQREPEPAQYHRRGADPGFHAPVAEILRDRAGRHRGRVLPQHRHEHEDRRDEYQRERDLRDRSGGERLDVSFRAALVGLFVPAREGCEEEEGDEGEDYGDDSMRGD